MEAKKKILLVTPVFPMPETGCDQADRAGGMRQLVRLGYEVTVITKVGVHADHEYLKGAAESLGVRLITVPYRYSRRAFSRKEWFFNNLGKLKNPLYLDGAAYEYAEPEIQRIYREQIESFKPDIAWFDYSYLWPLYAMAQKRGVPIVTRSLNFEPTHFLEEDGRSLVNYLKYIPKLLSEIITIWKSTLILALSPYEASVYRRIGAKRIMVVPLRGLPPLIRDDHEIRWGSPLHVFFMGSAYSVAHNERGLDLVTGVLAQRAARECPGAFVFHISGARIPAKYLSRFDGTTLINEGYIDADKFDAYMDRMDIALSPTPKYVGMQQKVYEPLCRGISLITPRCNLGGYPFEDGVHYMGADSEDEYFEKLLALRDPDLRTKLSQNSIQVARELFTWEANDHMLIEAMRKYLKIGI
ncbi:hypothetical protein HZC00_03015 [Candidatus Kaiserbacteria bacterium]|nr:hypothetical protein [Candidatus Kaiserbacteria bacterium]